MPDISAGYRISDRSGDESFAGLVGGLVADAQALVHREVDLAKQELLTEVDRAKQAAIILGIGGGVLAVGGLLLILMLVHGLVSWFSIPLWVSYLIVGAIFAIVGGVLLMRGQARLKALDPMPRQAIETVKENVEWIKEQSQ